MVPSVRNRLRPQGVTRRGADSWRLCPVLEAHPSQRYVSKGRRRYGDLPRIFISYRRHDSAAQAGRLYDELSNHFGKNAVYRDVDSMKPGVDFVERIERELKSAAAVIVVIGNSWLDATDAAGRRRLELADDYVRLELVAAFEQGKPVIPVLLGGAVMPNAAELPDDLAPLPRANALELVDRYWKWGVRDLIERLEEILRAPPGTTGVDSHLELEQQQASERDRLMREHATEDFLTMYGVKERTPDEVVRELTELRRSEPLLGAVVAAKPDVRDIGGGRGFFGMGESLTEGLLVATPTRLLYLVQPWTQLKTFEYPYERLAEVRLEPRKFIDTSRWYWRTDVLELHLSMDSGDATKFRVHDVRAWRTNAIALADVIHDRTADGVVDLDYQESDE
jgi:hypothetical protein